MNRLLLSTYYLTDLTRLEEYSVVGKVGLQDKRVDIIKNTVTGSLGVHSSHEFMKMIKDYDLKTDYEVNQ